MLRTCLELIRQLIVSPFGADCTYISVYHHHQHHQHFTEQSRWGGGDSSTNQFLIHYWSYWRGVNSPVCSDRWRGVDSLVSHHYTSMSHWSGVKSSVSSDRWRGVDSPVSRHSTSMSHWSAVKSSANLHFTKSPYAVARVLSK